MTTTGVKGSSEHHDAGNDRSAHTGTRGSRTLGIVTLVSVAVLLLFALVVSPPEATQGDAARLFYIHVPSAIVCLYLAFSITLVGSIMYLWKGTIGWDLIAGSAAEVGVLFLFFTLVTGMLWGKPTWGTYWQWDPRLTSTAVSFVLYLGYLAVRRLDMDPVLRSRRAAVLGIVSFANLIIVRYSVQWWRSLHQGPTLDPLDMQISGVMLFTWVFGVFTMLLVFSWLLLHRFRVAWLEHQLAEAGIDVAIRERRNEAGGDAALGGAI